MPHPFFPTVLLYILLATGCGSPGPTVTTITYQEVRDYPDLTEIPLGQLAYADAETKRFNPGYEHLSRLDLQTFKYRVGGQNLIGYAAFPKGPGPYPTIIYSRPGKYDNNWDATRAALRLGSLAAAGYAVITYDYGDGTPDPAADEFGGKDVAYLTGLIDTVAHFPKADPHRIGLYGWSRGGVMSLLALQKRPRHVKAVVAGGTPGDLEALRAIRPTLDVLFEQLIPDYVQDPDYELRRRSPVYFAAELPSDVPILLLHGTDDEQVPTTQAMNLAAALTGAGIPNQLELFEGEGHGISGQLEEVHDSVVGWFALHL